MTKKEKERQEAIAELRGMLAPGMEVVCILRHVSRSGMVRDISPHIIQNGQIRSIAWHTAKALDLPLKDSHGSNAVRVGGCGMDMGFHLVYNLGRVLFPEGFGIEGEKQDTRRANPSVKVRPASKEEAAEMVKRGVEFSGRNRDASGWDDDGGYALKCRWL